MLECSGMETVKEIRQCKKCGGQFPTTLADMEFYQKMQVPPSTLCPSCRRQRRLVWRNEWSFYQRKCDLTGKPIISYISPDKPIKVYSLDAWFSDKWNSLDYGMDFDFKRPFFEQFRELLEIVPHIPLLMGDCENSEYTNYSLGNKNCYLISAADYNEDCYYCSYLMRGKNCVDCFFVTDSELCYECTDCEKCYQVFFSQRCKNCQTSIYCLNCQGCTDCIGCINLRNKSYCIFNEKYTKEDYQKKRRGLLNDMELVRGRFLDLAAAQPNKFAELINSQDCFGNNLINSKNCFYCFDLVDSQDCRYVTYGIKARDCMDLNGAPDDELLYECVASPQCYSTKFSTSCWVKSSGLTYCHLCRASQYCFGCVSLYRNSYCILNKQYSKQEYEDLVPRIIEHMKTTGEWGEFFPIHISPFAYNETAAQEYFPLTKKEANESGYPWKDFDAREYKKSSYQIPNDIKDVSESILNEVLACEECGKNYKIILQELNFHKMQSLPIPRKCPDCRRKARVALRTPWNLRKDVCSKCGIEIYTSFSPEKAKNIYCEKCYSEAVY